MDNPQFVSPAALTFPFQTSGAVYPLPATGQQGGPGTNGLPGASGLNGLNCFVLLASPGMTVPSDNSNVQITVQPYGTGGTPCTAAFFPGQIIAIGLLGAFKVISVDNPTQMTIQKYAGNTASATASGGVVVGPSGFAPSYQPKLAITQDGGDSTNITLPIGYTFYFITKPTAAASGSDVILLDALSFAGQTVVVFNKSASARSITIAGAGSQLINDSIGSVTLAINNSYSFYSDGANWYVGGAS